MEMQGSVCEDIKRSVDLAGYVRGCGIKLERHGAKDLKGLCPFHDDHTPSLIVSPEKGLFHCPSCGAGGSVIDFAAKYKKSSVPEAIRELAGKVSPGAGSEGPKAPSAPVAELPLERQCELLEKTAGFYERSFANAAEGRSYLEGRGLTDAGLFTRHRIGFSDGSLLKALPRSGRMLEDLRALGVLLESGKERFLDCVVFPVLDAEGRIVTLYGRSLQGRRHVYLPRRSTGLFNCGAAKTYPEIVLVESVIDALSLEMCGVRNAVSMQGTNGLSEGDVRLLKELGVKRLLLLLDGDGPGRKASCELAARLSEHFSVADIPLPDGLDPNGCLLRHGAERLAAFLSSGTGALPAPHAPALANPHGGSVEPEGVQSPRPHAAIQNGCIRIGCGLRSYQVMGLERGQRNLKATVRAGKGGKLHVDTLDLYSARMRRQFAQDVCLAFEELPETLEADMARLLAACEEAASAAPGESGPAGESRAKESVPEMSPAERAEAEELGRSGTLVERILADFVKCGLVGEETNKLLCYLAMTSRKMEEPLSVLILSSSGAGKTALQDAALAFCPPEDLVKLTSLSARALFYKERTSLKHKVLAIEEGAGAEEASYAIRNLISSDSLTSEVAVRDPQTGKLTTMSNTVEGPAAVFCTTTDPEVDPETKSRFLVTGIDESREQTRRILEFQRQRRSPEGLGDGIDTERALAVHRNFQRLLKPLKVVNPLVDKLAYSDDRLQGRRGQPQYLNLISAAAFLRQLGKESRRHEAGGKEVLFIEVDEKDVELGNRLALEILGKTLDELSIPARNLLEQIESFVEGRVGELRKCTPGTPMRKSDIPFTRRELREFTGWTSTRLHIHLKELVSMEYILIDCGRGNSLQTYKLIYDGQGKDGEKFIPGLAGGG